MTIDRRRVLGRVLAGLAAPAAVAALPAAPAWAAAPLPQSQVAGAYHRRLGAMTVTALSDGWLDGNLGILAGIDAAAGEQLLARAFRKGVRLQVNAYLVNDGRRTVLIDAGTGTGMGPTLGRVAASLAAAGVSPGEIDLVLLTHVHPDHAGGLVAPGGGALFSNAEIALHQTEMAFWHDDAVLAAAPEGARPFFAMARDALAAYRGRVRTFERGEVASGIEAVAAAGHTPGHVGYLIGGGADQLLVWGDVVHVPAIQFARPLVTLAFDVDQPAAAATRRRLFDMAAADRLLVAGMHHDFPGFGHVVRDGDAYDLVIEPWSAAL